MGFGVSGGAVAEVNRKFINMQEPTGYLINPITGEIDRDSTVISWDNGTRTLSIDPTGTKFDYYNAGTRKQPTGANAQIDDIEGLWFFYFNKDGIFVTTQIFDLTIIYSLAFTAFLYWDATNKVQIGPFDERHGVKLDGHTHIWMHEKFGTRHDSGVGLNTINSAGTGSLDSHAQFGVDLGVIYDEDIRFDIDAIVSTVGLPILYLEGPELTPNLRETSNPGFSVITTGTGRMAFNELTGGNWQITEVSNNQYALCHVFATSGTGANTKGKLCVTMGQGDYITQNAARIGAMVEIKNLLSLLPVQEKDWIGTVIFQTGAYGNAVNARIRPNDLGSDWTDWRFWDYKDFLKDLNV